MPSLKFQKKSKCKDELKKLAHEIKFLKKEYRDAMRDKGDYWDAQVYCQSLRKEFRHRHVALCMVARNRTYEQVENSHSIGNALNQVLLQHYIDQYKTLLGQNKIKSFWEKVSQFFLG